MTIFNFIKKYLLALFCLLFITITSIGGIFDKNTIDKRENRHLEVFPSFKENTAKDYFEKLSLYVNDHFGMRTFFLNQDAKLSSLFNDPKIARADATLGKNGYAFYKGCLDLFFAKKYETNDFEHNVKQYSKLYPNTPIFVIIPPNKTEIYPEFVPENNNRTNTRDNMVNNLIKLSELSNVYVLDLKHSLIKLKEQSNNPDDIYPTNNTHWTGYAAYHAYLTTINFINQNSDFNLPIADDIKEVKIFNDSSSDLSNMLNQQKTFLDNNSKVILNNTTAKETPKLFPTEGAKIADYKNNYGKKNFFVIHDSFLLNSLGEYLAESINTMTNLWTTDFKLAKTQIDIVKPDAIIIQLVDRHIPKVGDMD